MNVTHKKVSENPHCFVSVAEKKRQANREVENVFITLNFFTRIKRHCIMFVLKRVEKTF